MTKNWFSLIVRVTSWVTPLTFMVQFDLGGGWLDAIRTQDCSPSGFKAYSISAERIIWRSVNTILVFDFVPVNQRRRAKFHDYRSLSHARHSKRCFAQPVLLVNMVDPKDGITVDMSASSGTYTIAQSSWVSVTVQDRLNTRFFVWAGH
jgi:hypothetical protein